MAEIKLRPKQIEYLESLTDRPLSRMLDEPRWFQKLWFGELVDIIGSTVYITDAGRRSLAKAKEAESALNPLQEQNANVGKEGE